MVTGRLSREIQVSGNRLESGGSAEMSSWGFESAIFRNMTAIEATLYVALGGFVLALILGGIGASLSDSGHEQASVPFLAFAMFGLGTCLISLGKAMLMYMGMLM